MKIPVSCGEAYKTLSRHFGTEDLGELSRLSKISRSTLAYWRSCGSARLRKNGRNHMRRIFKEVADGTEVPFRSHDPSLAAILEMFQEVRDILIRIEQKFIDRFS